MSARIQLALAAITALLIAGLVWLWYDNMELRWEAKEQVSEKAAENRMLAAVMLLRQAGHPVEVAGSLGAIDLRKLPDGTLIIGDQFGVTPPETARQLLAWVARGNTLVTQPRWSTPAERARRAATAAGTEDAKEDEDEDEGEDEDADAEESEDETPEPTAEAKEKAIAAPEALVETDPIAHRFGLLRYNTTRAMRACSAEHEKATAGTDHKHDHCIPLRLYRPPLFRLAMPNVPYPLTLDEGEGKLVSHTAAPGALWADDKGEVIRVYGEGQGRVVMMAGNYFTNADLRNYDHGELLLHLAALNSTARAVTIVKTLAVLPWYTALWRNYSYPLSAAAVFLVLLFWMAVRRFGPVLPVAAVERRSLMEHIAASGAWLWKTGDGRQLLLDAARDETLALAKRRVPALFRLPSQDLPAALARDAGLDPEHLAQALRDDASRQANRFTRQIRILQELRNHYER